MSIDWTTFVLQIVNFLVLVWILKRFLYRPILNTLARRRAAIDQTLAEVRETEAHAEELQRQYEGRLDQWAEERAASLARLNEELALERARQVQAVERELAQERARSAAIDIRRRDESRRAQEAQAVSHAVGFAAALLGRIASPAVESQMVALAIDDLGRLSEEQLFALRAEAADEGEPARVSTAFPVDAESRDRMVEALEETFGDKVAVDFDTDPGLLAGVRISLGSWRLQLDFADELADFATAADHGAE